MRVLFWGSPEFAVPSLEAINASAHRVVGVVCQPDRPRGRGLHTAACAVKQAAESLSLACLQPEKPRGEDFLSLIRGLEPDISVVVAYGHILRPEVLSFPPRGSINLHASILPAWRGAAPIQRAIAACDSRTGLTVIRMDEGMDTGDMLAVLETAIGEDETAGELSDRLCRLGGHLLVNILDRIERGTAEAMPQPAEGVSYAPKIGHEEARIDWNRDSRSLDCHVRAFDPWPGAFCLCRRKALKLFHPRPVGPCEASAGIVLESGESLHVACGDKTALAFAEVQAEGKRRMGALEWLRGAHVGPGERLE